MNPYVATAIAMVAIILLSAAATAYLAAVDGQVDLDEARVEGRYRGQIAVGRMASGQGGFGRLFHVELVDSAGGEGWEWSSLPDKKRAEPVRTFEGAPGLGERLGLEFEELAGVVPEDRSQRFGFGYDPAAGMIKLTREMRTRLDIPDADMFLRQLETLRQIGEANRRAQGEPGD